MKAAVVAIALVAFAISGQAQDAPAPGACITIPEAATAAGLTSLLQAVETAGLTSTLSDPAAALTVFAPTNEAFDAALQALNLPVVDLPSLQQQGLLEPILTNHVLAMPYNSTALQELESTAALGGQELSFGDGTVTTASGNSANIETPDVQACESYVHVIDAVLVPQLTGLDAGGAR